MPAAPIVPVEFETDAYQLSLYEFFRDAQQNFPVFRSEEGVVYLSKYADCQRLLQEDQFMRRPDDGGTPFSRTREELSSVENMIEHWMVYQDPPVHTRLRSAFTKVFTPRIIDRLLPDIEQIASRLIDELPAGGEFDFIDRVAYPLPILVIASFFDIPDINLHEFKQWSYQLTRSLNSGEKSGFIEAEDSVTSLVTFFSDLFNQRKENPGTDLLSRMILLEQENELSFDDVIYTCIFLVWAGHETTKLLIGSGTLLLLQNPEPCRFFREDKHCTPSLVDEILRFESPIQKLSRWTTRDVEFGDITVKKGSLITALLGAANRDPDTFEKADRFLPDRKNIRHISFGQGIHYCLGAYLARTEGRVLFDRIRPLIPRLELVSHAWRPISAFRSLDHLNIRIKE